MAQDLKSRVLRSALELQGNLLCFDCGSAGPEFASVNNGVFLCENCSVLHSELPGTLSTVKCLTADFTVAELKSVLFGGNSSLQAFFRVYGIGNEGPVSEKYSHPAAGYYRDMLHKAVLRQPTILDVDNSLYRVFDEPEEETEEEKQPAACFSSLFCGGLRGNFGEIAVNTLEWSAMKALRTFEWSANKGTELMDWGGEVIANWVAGEDALREGDTVLGDNAEVLDIEGKDSPGSVEVID